MKILVTGGGGFLGSYLIRELVKDESFKVYSFSRHQYPFLSELGVTTLRGDLRNPSEIEDALKMGFDAIIHTAALAGVWGKKEDYISTNYEATKNLLACAKDLGVKLFIYTSTPSVVFKEGDLLGVDESEPYAQKFYNAYMESKILAEKEVLSFHQDGFSTLAIRPHLIWGKGDPHLFSRIIQKARLGKLKIVGDGENLVDIIHVENAALAHVQALKKLSQNHEIGGKAYFIGQERPVKLWAFINDVLKKLEIEPVEDQISLKKAYILGAIFEKIYRTLGINKPEPPMTKFVALNLASSHYFSHEKAKVAFGYSPKVSIEDGIEKTFFKAKF